MNRPTALRIPSPWSGDERDPVPRSYRWWFALYRSTRKLRHLTGLHDWNHGCYWYCTWCGKAKKKSKTTKKELTK